MPTHCRVLVFVHVAMIGCLARGASAQDRPFVFTATTATDTSQAQLLVIYDVGAGERTFHSDTENGPEQRIGIQASLGRWALVGNLGVASAAGGYQTSQQEVLFSLLNQRSAGVILAAGGGMLREAGGTNVALARIVAGHDDGPWQLRGNLVLEHAMAPNRDAIDLVTTVGWARRLTSAVSLGVEGIGEDLEGFWDPTEAEGGARLLVGPSLHVAPPGRAWQFSVAGGPTFHPSDTGLSSGALRDLPPQTPSRGYAIRTSLSCTF